MFYIILKLLFFLADTSETDFLYPICRNILALTNQFEFSDQNITLENYDNWFEYLNRTSPDEVASVSLKTCNLQTFLDQVL